MTRKERSIDLHGLTVAEAIPKVERALNDAILADIDRIEIIHGKGTGKIKNSVHKFLKEVGVVSSFKIDEFNPGVTWVYL